MQNFSFKRFLGLVLLIALGAGIGLSVQFFFFRNPIVQEAPTSSYEKLSSSKVEGLALACDGESSFSNNLYPSLMLSFGGVAPEFVTCITVHLRNAELGQKYQIKVSSHLFQTSFVKTIEIDNPDFSLTPDIPWNYAALRSVTQVRPETIVISVIASSGKRAQASFVATVHPINEVVTRVFDSETGKWQDTSICFAAYVNESHPLINSLIQEATLKSGIARFSGYEFGPKSVREQIQAVWDTLAARGLNYIDLATTSVQVSKVSSQYVRFIDQSLKDQGANCVDASVLLASIFRRIGLRPVLIFIPGHCFVGVYDADKGGQLIPLETTLLSSTSFANAESAGEKEMSMALDTMGQPGYSSVDISLARDSGVLPIEYTPTP